MSGFLRGRGRILVLSAVGLLAVGAVVPTVIGGGGGKGGGKRQVQIPATLNDFFQPGTQPNTDSLEFNPISPSSACSFCHSDYSPTAAQFDNWVTSLMGQSARDPVWHAALAIANQDVAGGGEFCIRCHAPGAWLAGKSTTGTTIDFTIEDFDGINCNVCHRVVNPVYGKDSAVGYPGDPVDPDAPILSALAANGLIPQGAGNARYIIDPDDTRRGPLDDVPLNLHGLTVSGEPVRLIYSPFHKKSEFCGTCHDVSNPAYVKDKKGKFVLGALDAPHPTQNPMDMFPEQRTYSEWALSEFASTGVSFPDDRFGGPDHPTGIMQSCQDCHMPTNYGGACAFAPDKPFFFRDVHQHSFAGANTWVVDAIRTQLGEEADFTGLTEERVQTAKARTIQMLRDASDLVLTHKGGQLVARVINQSGHKLPTGYPEGRRMWLNVKFFDAKGQIVQEIGGYDFKNAVLDLAGTKVWEAKHGIDQSVARLTGLPAGPNFHLILANTKFKDNRIPPRGFNNASFAAAGAAPVAATYADGQYWDDTTYPVPQGAKSAIVTLYYQTTTREYIEFLRDKNRTNDRGQVAYDLWVQHGKSSPVDMDVATILFEKPLLGDLNGDGAVDAQDLAILLGQFGTSGSADFDGSGMVDAADLAILLGAWTG
jgi:hypothetical protein